MAKKKTKSTKTKAKAPKPALVQKIILFPEDWIPRIDAARGSQKLSDFVREAVRARIDSQGLSEPPGPGRPWPKTE